MGRKKSICLLLAGILLVLAGANVSKGQAAAIDSTNKKETTVAVEGLVYDARGQQITDHFTTVEASTRLSEYGGAAGEVYISTLDENGKYHMELPGGAYYYFHFHFHNRSFAKQYWVDKDCVINLHLECEFYQMSGNVYLNGQPYRNGVLRIERVKDDPSTSFDDYFTDIITDENGYYEFCFPKGIDGAFAARYQIKEVMYGANNLVNLPGTNVSGYDIFISGNISQDLLPTNTPAATIEVSQAPQTPSSPTARPEASMTPAPTKAVKNPAQKKDNVNTAVDKNVLKKGVTFTQKGFRYRIISYSTKKKEVLLLGCTKKNTKKLVIPAYVTTKKTSFCVTEIASKAFCCQRKLTSVLIGNNVQKIGTQAFYKDSALKKIVFKTKKVKKVGTKAFVGINNNARIVILTSCKKKYVRLLEGKY